MKTENQQLIFGGQRQGGTQYFLWFQRDAVFPYQRALDADKGVLWPETGECDAVSGGKSRADDLICLYQLRDGCSVISGQKERTAAAGNPMGQQCAAAGAAECQKIPVEAAQRFRCVRNAKNRG